MRVWVILLAALFLYSPASGESTNGTTSITNACPVPAKSKKKAKRKPKPIDPRLIDGVE